MRECIFGWLWLLARLSKEHTLWLLHFDQYTISEDCDIQYRSRSIDLSINIATDQSIYHSISLPINQSDIQYRSRSINLSFNIAPDQSIYQSISLQINRSVIQYRYRSINLSFNIAPNQSICHSIPLPINQSIIRPLWFDYRHPIVLYVVRGLDLVALKTNCV